MNFTGYSTPSKADIRASFSKAAEQYEEHAHIQKEVACLLFSRILADSCKYRLRQALEIGTGTGILTRKLIGLHGIDLLITMDISSEMAAIARQHCSIGLGGRRVIFISGDGEALPFSPGIRFDLIASSSTMQWFHHLPTALFSMVAHLNPGGILHSAFFIKGTLYELESALQQGTGKEDVKIIASNFFSGNRIEKQLSNPDLLPREKFSLQLDQLSINQTFPDLKSLLRTFRNTGTAPGRRRSSYNPSSDPVRYLSTPRIFSRVERAFWELFGEIRVTYSILFLRIQRLE